MSSQCHQLGLKNANLYMRGYSTAIFISSTFESEVNKNEIVKMLLKNCGDINVYTNTANVDK